MAEEQTMIKKAINDQTGFLIIKFKIELSMHAYFKFKKRIVRLVHDPSNIQGAFQIEIWCANSFWLF